MYSCNFGQTQIKNFGRKQITTVKGVSGASELPFLNVLCI